MTGRFQCTFLSAVDPAYIYIVNIYIKIHCSDQSVHYSKMENIMMENGVLIEDTKYDKVVEIY